MEKFPVGVEIELENSEDFLKIKETLTRIGIASRKENKLWQSCHILHKKGRFAIVHFKEMFQLDGKTTDFSEEDLARRNKIVSLLRDWKLLKVLEEDKIKAPLASMNQIKVIAYAEKSKWVLESKYTIGKRNKETTA
jgi:Bacteriophage translational regulator